MDQNKMLCGMRTFVIVMTAIFSELFEEMQLNN